MKSTNLKVLSTTLRGQRNKNRNLPCQDYVKHSTKGRNFVAVISDGAGSAKYGKIGARIVCETVVDLLKNAPFDTVRETIAHAIGVAREKLERHRFNKKNINAFAATVIGLVHNKKQGVFFHIGDGAAIAFNDRDYENFIISKPENGSFSCETYFYTMEEWKSALRFTTFENYNTFILMSDGLTNFSFTNRYDRIEEKFLAPINDFLNQEHPKYKAIQTLNKTLGSPKAEKINPDDKTILWAKL